MIKLKHTNRTMHEVGNMLRKGLRQELIDQKHNASRRLSNGLKYHVNKRTNTMSVFASVSYWQDESNIWYGGSNPNIGWSQIISLDSPNQDWSVDLDLDSSVKIISGK